MEKVLEERFSNETIQIIQRIKEKRFQAILVYPEPIQKEPSERYRKILQSFATRGYLCFLCHQAGQFSLQEIEENLFSLSKQEYLLPILRSQSCLVLSSDVSQIAWAGLLPHKYLWFDILEEVKSEGIQEQADLITYESDSPNTCVKCTEESIKASPKGFTLFANLHPNGEVAVCTKTFFDFDGKYFYCGGAERYLIDLAAVCAGLGRKLTIYQYGNSPWMRRYNNIDVISLSRGKVKAQDWSFQILKEFNHIFYEIAEQRASLNIYSAFYEAWPLGASNSIGISHGVAWDDPYADYENALQFLLLKQQYIKGAKACEEIVSVDTNTANWFQTVDYKLGQQIKVVPNYVDLEKFYPSEEYLVPKEKIVVLYPRQLYAGRGMYMVLEVLDGILEQFPQVEFRFLGRGIEADTVHVVEKMEKWKERVRWDELSLEEMPEAYRYADISLIPTLHSEGTSLSCLEAMASGNAVIATRVGGLTDLVLNRFNGLLIEPNAKALEMALMELIENQELLLQFKKRGVEVAQSFSRELWSARWASILENKLVSQELEITSSGRLVEIHLEQLPVDYAKLGNLVTNLLKQGDLIYLRIKGTEAGSMPSFGRVQWVGWSEPIFSNPDLTIEFREGETG